MKLRRERPLRLSIAGGSLHESPSKKLPVWTPCLKAPCNYGPAVWRVWKTLVEVSEGKTRRLNYTIRNYKSDSCTGNSPSTSVFETKALCGRQV